MPGGRLAARAGGRTWSPARSCSPRPPRATRRRWPCSSGSGTGWEWGSLVTIFDPDLVVVGGGVAATGDLLLAPARRSSATSTPATTATCPRWSRPGLGADAGLVGAATPPWPATDARPGPPSGSPCRSSRSARAGPDRRRDARRLGFGGVFVFDHLWLGALTRPALECWTLLAAGRRGGGPARVGTLVTGPGCGAGPGGRMAATVGQVAGVAPVIGVGRGDPANQPEPGLRAAVRQPRRPRLGGRGHRRRPARPLAGWRPEAWWADWAGRPRPGRPAGRRLERLGPHPRVS